MDTMTAAATVATVADLLDTSEQRRMQSSLEIDGNVGRAFRMIWSHRLGYASTMSDADWAALQALAARLGVTL